MQSTSILWVIALLIAFSLSDSAAPSALVVPASEYFEGNDGPWSTFDIRVGTPEQDIRVLVSTASPESLVALSDYGCSTAAFETVPPNCAVLRGRLFNPNQSSSWHDVGTYGINENGVGLEANLGYSQRVEFALEHMGIGLTGPSLDNQTIGGIATAEPFYLGLFGLSSQPVNFSSLGNYSSSSFVTTLKDQKIIPSLSWSYTAGARYRLKQVYGQLIFSGYDTSRFMKNTATFTMADDVTRDLVVALQSISYSGTTSATLLSNAIDIFIDSTDPNIWLPGDACDAFEKAFGLSLDNKTGLYLVNETYHNTLLNSNPEVSFRLSDVKSGGGTVTITLPYAAFDLTADYPLVDNKSYYFPLKRANNSTQYTLGRTFLQEAYLSADYERRVFNVSACAWNEGTQENIVTITSKDSDPSASGGSSSGTSSHLSGGAIGGIVVACVIAGIAIALVLAYFILRKRRKWMKAGFAVTATDLEPAESVLKGPVFNSAPQSTPDDFTLLSAADISAPRSTTEYSRSTVESPPRPFAVGENISGTSTSELDARDTQIKPTTELDGHPLSRVEAVYELPGTEVAAGGDGEKHADQVSLPGTDSDRGASTVPALPSRNEIISGSDSPDSTFVSTLDTNIGQDERADFNLVSPSTPTHHASRPF